MLSISVIMVIYLIVAVMVLVLLFAHDGLQKLEERRVYKKLLHNLEELQTDEWELPMEAHLKLQMMPFPIRYYTEQLEARDNINRLMVKLSRKIPRENTRI